MLALFASAAVAQPVQEAPSAAAIEAKRKAVEDNAQLAPEVKAKALDLYARAATAVEKAAEGRARLAALTERVEKAPERIAELRAALEAGAAPEPESVDDLLPPDPTIDQVQAIMSEKSAALGTAREALQQLEATLEDHVTSGGALVKEWVERDAALRQLAEEGQAPPPADEPLVLSDARSSLLSARRALERVQFDLLQRRARNYDLLMEVMTLERDAKAAELEVLRAQVQMLDAALKAKREADARLALRQAEATLAAASELPPPIAAIAEGNTELKAETEQVVGKENSIDEELRAVSARFQRTNAELASLRERVRTYGASLAVGRLLQRSLERLPSARERYRWTSARRDEIARATERVIDVGEARLALGPIPAEADAVLATLSAGQAPSDTESLRERTIALLTARRDALAELERAYGRYLTRLTALETAEREFAAAVHDGAEFIRRQLTWIPNLPAFVPGDLAQMPATLGSLFSDAIWGGALQSMRNTWTSHPGPTLAAAVVLLGVIAVRRRAPRHLRSLGERTVKVRTDSFGLTLKALVYTLVAAGLWALVTACVGWSLRADVQADSPAFALGGALLGSVVFVYALTLLRWVTRPEGLVHRHFRWPTPVWHSLHRELTWLAPLLIPASIIVRYAAESGGTEYAVTVGRPVLVVALLVIAVFLWRVFGSGRPLVRHLAAEDPEDWRVRFHPVWFGAIMTVPVVLAAGSMLGYHLTASELTALAIGKTAYLIVGLILLKHVLLRWFYVAERRSRFETLVHQREESRAERPHEDAERAFFEVEEPGMNYRELGEQARSAVGAAVFLGLVIGTFALWSQVLPTLGFLDQVKLPLSKVTLVEGVEQVSSVTLFDVAIALLILGAAVFATKHLSGLLEFALLRRLRLDPGGRYAIVTLFQYFIIAIGVIAAFSTIGMQWSKLQWLIAALGVGLGFGLQEIVANFVSGIILLLERPVRVGDIVTVGNADGYISRIQIRATTILTWEKKELIVPNKEFITGQVVNWTLSDSVNRILINIGIAYGSDPSKALALIAEAAEENDQVLNDPAPLVTFEAFGDNALMLYLRCYIASMDNRLAVVTALHQAIYDKLKAAGIVIAFPQRDIHLDTSQPLEVRVRQDESEAAGLRTARSSAG